MSLAGLAVAEPRGRRKDGLERATELALVGVTIAAIVGMHLLFADGSFFPPLVLQALIAHAALAGLRRLEIRLLPAACITAVVAALSITWFQYLDTTVALLPSSETLETIRTQVDEAWRLFQDVRAPAPVVPGFLVTTSAAVWVIVFIADWGAFRTGVSFEALLPPATLFLFAAVLGEPGGARAPGAALFVAAALVFLLLHRTWRQEGTATWAAISRDRGRWSMLASGAALAAFPVLASAIVGPNLPGADDPPVVPWRQLTDEEKPRVVISPLVDIRSRLIDQADVEVFQVETDRVIEGPYWRLTTLDTYEAGEDTDEIWRSSYDTHRADGELPESVDANPETTRVDQTITIKALGAIWLPAAYQPVALDMGDSETEVDYDRNSQTLIVDRNTPTSDQLTYTVTSDIPTWTDEQLRSASTDRPRDITDRYLQLPRGFSPEITELARQWTAGADTQYDAAKALQDRLRNDFDYDTAVQPGHSEDALMDFLFVNRRGYCEQFAGAFAAMARSIDIPTRVAVGFTKGTPDRFEPTLWRVTGRQAHAWVEVYFEGFGWVTFDPTPGRAPSGADAWLGVNEQQATRESDQPVGSSEPDGAGTTTPNGGAPQPDGNNPNPDLNVGGGESSTSPSPTPDNDHGWLTTVARMVGFGLLAYLLLVPLSLVVARYVRRFRARAAAEKVDLAWREVGEEAAEAGIRLPDSLTVGERARRLRAALPDRAQEIQLVAQWVERVNYAEIAPTPAEADAAARAAASIRIAASRRLPLHVRLLRWFDARRLRRLLPRQEARRSAQSAVRTA